MKATAFVIAATLFSSLSASVTLATDPTPNQECAADNKDCAPEQNTLPDWIKVVGTLPSVKWRDVQKTNGDASDYLSRAREPTLVTKSPNRMWTAIEKWQDPAYLARNVRRVKAFVGNHTVFIRENAKADLRVSRDSLAQPQLYPPLSRKKRTIEVADLMNLPAAVKGYFNGPLGDKFEWLEPDIKPWAPFAVIGDWVDCKGERTCEPSDSKGSLLNAWIMPPGIANAVQFNVDHAYLAQITGMTRVWVAKAKSLPLVRPHPNGHHRAFQSQREAADVDSVIHAEATAKHLQEIGRASKVIQDEEQIEFEVVDVKPGQAVYIPPLHPFRVESVGDVTSVGALVISPSKETVAVQAIMHAIDDLALVESLAETFHELTESAVETKRDFVISAKYVLESVQKLKVRLKLPNMSTYMSKQEEVNSESVASTTGDVDTAENARLVVEALLKNSYTYRPEFAKAIGCDSNDGDDSKWCAVAVGAVNEQDSRTQFKTGLAADATLQGINSYVRQLSVETKRGGAGDKFGGVALDWLSQTLLESLASSTIPLSERCAAIKCLASKAAWAPANEEEAAAAAVKARMS